TEFIREDCPDGCVLFGDLFPQRIALSDTAADIADHLGIFMPCEIGNGEIGDLLRIARVETVNQVAVAARHIPADTGSSQQQRYVGDRKKMDDVEARMHQAVSET